MIKEPSFPSKPDEAIRRGFEAAEKCFLENAAKMPTPEKSGSCAIVLLIVGEVCYAVNVGDSRAILSYDSGRRVADLSEDHKPSERREKRRILENQGQIYQTATIAQPQDENGVPKKGQPEIIIGPVRVFPGRLSVCRTFGDFEAKDVAKGGNPNVVIAKPEIKSFKMEDNHDFVILGCDGIFDKLTNQDCVTCVWD